MVLQIDLNNVCQNTMIFMYLQKCEKFFVFFEVLNAGTPQFQERTHRYCKSGHTAI